MKFIILDHLNFSANTYEIDVDYDTPTDILYEKLELPHLFDLVSDDNCILKRDTAIRKYFGLNNHEEITLHCVLTKPVKSSLPSNVSRDSHKFLSQPISNFVAEHFPAGSDFHNQDDATRIDMVIARMQALMANGENDCKYDDNCECNAGGISDMDSNVSDDMDSDVSDASEDLFPKNGGCSSDCKCGDNCDCEADLGCGPNCKCGDNCDCDAFHKQCGADCKCENGFKTRDSDCCDSDSDCSCCDSDSDCCNCSCDSDSDDDTEPYPTKTVFLQCHILGLLTVMAVSSAIIAYNTSK